MRELFNQVSGRHGQSVGNTRPGRYVQILHMRQSGMEGTREDNLGRVVALPSSVFLDSCSTAFVIDAARDMAVFQQVIRALVIGYRMVKTNR